ncbi:MAG: hypothetical protein QM804_01100 [Propionicimonas sp.]
MAISYLLLAGCGAMGSSPVPSPSVTVSHGGQSRPTTWPGEFLVRYGGTELALAPFTYCYTGDAGGVCVDGFDDDPPSVGAPDEVAVFVPVPGFDELTVTQSSAEGECSVEADTVPLDGGWWTVRPRGPAGEYVVSIFASGDGGDMVAEVVWRTPSGRGGSCS